MDTRERLKHLRMKLLGLTQPDFAAKIGLKSASIVHMMESGMRQITDRTIKSIHDEFHVSEAWLRTGEGNVFLPSVVADPEKQYDQHGGYKPDPEKALGIERGTQQWKAFEMLSKIYASADQQLIGAIFSNLKSFADAADQKRENVELKRKVDELDVRLNEMAGQLNQKGIIRFIERRSGADRRRASCKCPTEIERRTGRDRRRDVVNNNSAV
jgi:transcriptional regulator with XRE-family HTH domain